MSVYFYFDDATRNETRSDASALSAECELIYELTKFDKDDILLYTEESIKNTNLIHKLRLLKGIYEPRMILLCKNDESKYLVNDFSDVFVCDYTLINLDLVHSAIYSPSKEDVKEDTTKLEEILNSDKSSEQLKDLASQLIVKSETINTLKEENTKLQATIGNLATDLSLKENALNSLLGYYDKVVEKAIDLNNSMEQYKVVFAEDIYEKVNAFRYKNRPKILYIKEYQELLKMYEFLFILRTAVYKQMHLSCKVVTLFDSTTSMRIKTLPNYYHVINNKFTRSEVYKNDYITCVGDYRKVLGLLLENPLKLDIIIICDCLPHADITIQDSMLQYAFCRDSEVADRFALGQNTFTNDENEKYRWYKGFDLQNESYIACSSSDVISGILKEIEEFSLSL